MTVWVLGDQLSPLHGPLAQRETERVLMIEAHEFARRHAYHPHKLTLVFSAMRHFRDELRESGRTVEYYQVETFAEGLDRYFQTHPEDHLVVMVPASHGGDRLQTLVQDRGGTLELVENDLFCCSVERFDEWASDRSRPYRQEQFYRMMRRETGYLMTDGAPVGGDWNYDDANQRFPGTEYEAPEPLRFDPDETTAAVAEWVEDTFDGSYDTVPPGGAWASPEAFGWPVTRDEALRALDDFCDHRLAEFGPYQDAMLADDWAMNHALLSPALNLCLLHPTEVIEHVLDAGWSDPDVPVESIEGFLRQVLGWREFTRHIYRTTMPELAEANQLEAHEDLPEMYWSGDTDMACLADIVERVRARGYSHHIERLMVLSNFALLYGVEPRQLNEWFHAAYVDAYHWVTTPNVVEMGSYGAGAFATKPYAASANYINKMSDYCAGCRYDHRETTGSDACPFNALYWEFLDRNESQLRSNHRMGLVYTHLDRKDEAEQRAITDRADEIRELAEDESL